MTDAPERIWVNMQTETDIWTWDENDTFPQDVKYIRADIAEAEKRAAVALLQEIATSGRCDFQKVRNTLAAIRQVDTE